MQLSFGNFGKRVCFSRHQLKKKVGIGGLSLLRGGDPSLLHFLEVVPAALEWEGGGREKEEPAGEEKNTNLPRKKEISKKTFEAKN